MINVSDSHHSSSYSKIRITVVDSMEPSEWKKVVRFIPKYLRDGHYRLDLHHVIPVTIDGGDIYITGHGNIKLYGDYRLRITERTVYYVFFCARQKCWAITNLSRPMYSTAHRGFVHPVYDGAESFMSDTSAMLVYNDGGKEVLYAYGMSPHYEVTNQLVGSRPISRLARFLDIEYWRGFFIVARNKQGSLYVMGSQEYHSQVFDSRLMGNASDRIYTTYAIPVESFFVTNQDGVKEVSVEHVSSLCTAEAEYGITAHKF